MVKGRQIWYILTNPLLYNNRLIRLILKQIKNLQLINYL
jgi:hypothetical protein